VNAREILRRLVRRFGLLLLLTLIGGVAGAAYGALKTPTYTAKAYVVAVPISAQGDPISALNFAQAYGRVATSDPVLAKAGVLLGADQSGLRQATAATSPDAPVIEITATGPRAKHTAAVANSVANALVEYGGNRKAETRVGLSLLAGAITPTRPTSPKPPMELAVGAAGGLLIGGLAVLAGVGRPAARAKDERADSDEEPVGGHVPRYQMADVDAIEEIDRHSGIDHLPRAITTYRATATPTYVVSDDDEDEESGDRPSIPSQRVVGRAAVSQEEDQ
jgi:capsular polysaccharide biosynthesis protein